LKAGPGGGGGGGGGATTTPPPVGDSSFPPLPPAADPKSRLFAVTTAKDGTVPRVYVTRAGKTYLAGPNATFESGDRIRTDANTVLTLEFLIGGRVGLAPNAEVAIVSDRSVGSTEKHGVVRVIQEAGKLTLDLIKGAPCSRSASRVVGTVTALGGTKKLQVRAGKRLRALHRGDKVTLDQVLVMGKGVKATIRLERPKGVKNGTELIQLTAAKGAKPILRTTVKKGVITVKIAPR
jgi:hypothetical protein